ncbi:hypothetical protein EV360DRAFT_30125, partial [Lentinula raphanica]
CANVAHAVPFLSAYTQSGTDHLYTTNTTEMNNALAASYSFEGDAAFVWSTQETFTVPLYRMFSQSLNDHFYTIDANETSQAMSLGYALENDSHIAGYVYPYRVCGASPIYRLYSSSSGDHFYTMSIAESRQMSGYVVEGIAGFALLPSPDGQRQSVTVSASPFLLPISLVPSPVPGSISTSLTSFSTTVDINPTSSSAMSNPSGRKVVHLIQSAVAAGYQAQGIAGYAMLPSPNGTVEKESAVPYVLPSTVTASPESQSTAASSSCANVANAVPLLRAYTLSGSDHFYTTNSTEMSNALAASYSFEGDAAFVWSTQETSTVPLYRMFSQNSNDHFYTIDANETSEALSLGYAFESDSHIAGYVYPYSVCGASPIYRLYSSSGGDHFYTMSRTEGSAAPGYVVEGIAGFAL